MTWENHTGLRNKTDSVCLLLHGMDIPVELVVIIEELRIGLKEGKLNDTLTPRKE